MTTQKEQGNCSLSQLSMGIGVSTSYLPQVINGKRPPSDKLVETLSTINPEVLSNLKPKVKQFVKQMLKKTGAGDEIRTRDFLLGKETCYHCTTPALK
jgi:transcriptional regulator with XRE-family HTH domain